MNILCLTLSREKPPRRRRTLPLLDESPLPYPDKASSSPEPHDADETFYLSDDEDEPAKSGPVARRFRRVGFAIWTKPCWDAITKFPSMPGEATTKWPGMSGEANIDII